MKYLKKQYSFIEDCATNLELSQHIVSYCDVPGKRLLYLILKSEFFEMALLGKCNQSREKQFEEFFTK